MLYLAAALTIFIGLVHSYLGDRWLIRPILKLETLPIILGSRRATEHTLRFAWHITSLAWWGMAGLMVIMVTRPDMTYQAALWMFIIVFGLSGIIPLALGGKHKSWIVFLAISGLCAAQIIVV